MSFLETGAPGRDSKKGKCHQADLLYDDPFELAFQEASSRAWESWCRAFHSGKQSFFLRIDNIKQVANPTARRSSRVRTHQSSALQFASTSLKFVPDPQNANGSLSADHPSLNQLLNHPLALLSYIPKDAALFVAGAIAGATARTVTAPLDRTKLLMQVHSVRTSPESVNAGMGFVEAVFKIWKEEGLKGYWKGNLPQVLRLIPYSAIQLTSYELYKKLLKGNDQELSVINRLAAGACAGMTSTLVTYPLDVLRLRLAVDPTSKSLIQVASTMLREEGLSSFYGGLGPSLLGIAPYIALNFCAFDFIRLTTFDTAKSIYSASEVEYQRAVKESQEQGLK